MIAASLEKAKLIPALLRGGSGNAGSHLPGKSEGTVVS